MSAAPCAPPPPKPLAAPARRRYSIAVAGREAGPRGKGGASP